MGAIGLKEWAAAVEALRTGEQIVIMRKGGIREETRDFSVQTDCFYFYPGYEHQRTELMKTNYVPLLERTMEGWQPDAGYNEIRVYAELADDLLITSQEELDKLDSVHVWAPQFAEQRLKWKRTKPLHLMLVRVYELEKPVKVPVLPEYSGCKSWITLPDQLEDVPRRPVLAEADFQSQVSRVKGLLGL